MRTTSKMEMIRAIPAPTKPMMDTRVIGDNESGGGVGVGAGVGVGCRSRDERELEKAADGDISRARVGEMARRRHGRRMQQWVAERVTVET